MIYRPYPAGKKSHLFHSPGHFKNPHGTNILEIKLTLFQQLLPNFYNYEQRAYPHVNNNKMTENSLAPKSRFNVATLILKYFLRQNRELKKNLNN